MTFIQPKRQSQFHFILAVSLITVLLLVGAVALIVLYNQTVDARHALAREKEAFNKLQTENAEIKERMFALLDNHNLEAVARGRQLVKENTPRYFEGR
jgi:cell division protein FtsB